MQQFPPGPYDFVARARGGLFSTHTPQRKTASELELGKTFDPKAAEEQWFQLWIDRGYFKADPDRAGKVFSIVIPPPNVTGQLHLGSAFNNVLQDVIVRTRRMQGYNTLWVPGTDHAGIATQNVVEREIAKDGKSRHDLGRDRLRRARVGMARNLRRPHPVPVAPARRFVRLEPRALHARPRAVARGGRGFRPALSRGSDLPRPPVDQLVSAMRNGALRPRGRSQGRRRPSVLHPLSARRRHRLDHSRDDAARDDAWRYRRRRESRGRALHRPGRKDAAPAADRARDSDHRGCGGRSRSSAPARSRSRPATTSTTSNSAGAIICSRSR